MILALRLSQPLPQPSGSCEDFVARREKIVKEGQNQPTARLSAMLEVLSRRNAEEGGDPYLIDDDLSSPFIIDLHGFSKQQLNECLRELEARKLLITTETGSLRLSREVCARSRDR